MESKYTYKIAEIRVHGIPCYVVEIIAENKTVKIANLMSEQGCRKWAMTEIMKLTRYATADNKPNENEWIGKK